MLLEITPIAKSEDVHEVVGRIQQKAQQILSKELKLDSKAIMGFAMTLVRGLSEHRRARGPGRLGRRAELQVDASASDRRVVVIAVCDAGLGFRQSLESDAGSRAPSDRDGTTPRRSRRP